jgi:hypothetical protein
MSLTIGPYEGDGDDLARLIVSTWRASLGARAWFPIWDEAFIRWKVMDERVLDRDLVTVARDEDGLVGCCVGLAYPFRMRNGEIVAGSLTSFLSVDPTRRVPGLALRLVEANRRAQAAKGIRLSLGVHDASVGAPAAKFWGGWKKRHPQEFVTLGRIRIWTHVFDGPAVARASIALVDRLAARIGAFLPLGYYGAKGAGARPAESEIARDLAIARQGTGREDFRVELDEETLSHALHHPYCLSVRHPTEDALVAGYMIDWSGRADLRVGFIDLVAGRASARPMADTIIAFARAARGRGAKMVAMMDQGAAPPAAFWLAGFAPLDSHVDYFVWFKDPALEIPAGSKVAAPFT